MKKRLSVLLALVFCFTLVTPMSVLAKDNACGDSLTWTLSSDGVLSISGTGEMDDYDGILFNAQAQRRLPEYAPWYEYRDKIKTVQIENGVTSIGDNAFYSLKVLESAKIPESVVAIGEGAFYGCSKLTSVNIPSKVSHIFAQAFRGCSSLTNINLPDGIKSIAFEAFRECDNLKNISIPDSVINIGQFAFANCSDLTNINFGNRIICICSYAFAYCNSLINVDLPDSIKAIGEYAFFRCTKLNNLSVPASVIMIGNGAFSGCDGLPEIKVNPDNKNYMSNGGVLFSKKGDILICYPGGLSESYTIPDNVEQIACSAFDWCKNLKKITIPVSVTFIRLDAFRECTNLKELLYLGSREDWNNVRIEFGQGFFDALKEYGVSFAK